MVRTDKLVICVAPCGSFLTKEANPNMPIQPDEIAEEVYRLWNEGAFLAHIHVRDKVEGDTAPYGSVNQDVPGAAQGAWFLSGISETYPENPHIALVHSNIHPDRAVLSIGNSIPGINSGVYEFLPKNSGLMNRDFPDIIPDGQIYGFQINGQYGLAFYGIIIVMMPDTETLWIEALRGATTNPTSWAFTENKTVFKR